MDFLKRNKTKHNSSLNKLKFGDFILALLLLFFNIFLIKFYGVFNHTNCLVVWQQKTFVMVTKHEKFNHVRLCTLI